MRRRDFLLSGLAAASIIQSAAAQSEQRRIGILMNLTESDPESQARLRTFMAELQKLGWSEGHNLRVDLRWGEGKPENFRHHAAELVALAPDLLLAASGPVLAQVQAATRTIPVVFAQVVDPIGGGLVDNLHRPGGNTTGFTLFEYNMSPKWLELLKEVAPHVARAAVLYDPAYFAGIGQLKAIEAAAPMLGIDLTAIDLRDAKEIEHGIRRFAASANGGLIVTAGPSLGLYRRLISSLATTYRLPAVYPFRRNAIDGGLIAYGPNLVDSFRRAADYVDRILRGASPGNLPIQTPVAYELVINLKAAAAMGLTVPASLLARADEVIE